MATVIPRSHSCRQHPLFLANDGTNGHELWKSDGTASGTVMVRNIRSGSSSSSPSYLTVVGNTLFFKASDGTNGYELWKSDGTTSGTVMVKDIYSGSSSSYPSELTVVGSTLYFEADDGTTDTNCGRAMEQPQARLWSRISEAEVAAVISNTSQPLVTPSIS